VAVFVNYLAFYTLPRTLPKPGAAIEGELRAMVDMDFVEFPFHALG